MGVRHLTDLREFLKKNFSKSYKKTQLRNELKQNYKTIIDNVNYLLNIEKVIEELPNNKFQWEK
jgi:RNA processing factor Prp31